ncbi:MAG: hypothetical protein JWM80_6415, partial [Cyanobacteria bacterium RYN_339]|nr:hypothetical protein [Cyanobacteria bacterium RYN_339]
MLDSRSLRVSLALLLSVVASHTPAFASSALPSVKHVTLDSKLVHRENDLFEEDEFTSEIAAFVNPAPGHPSLDAAKIRVYYLGALVT